MGVRRLAGTVLMPALSVVSVGCSKPPPLLGPSAPVAFAHSGVQVVRRSVYEGVPIQHPDDLAGIWDAPDGRGGTVGLNLVLWTTISANRTKVAGSPQAWQSLTAILYDRRGAVADRNERNVLADSAEQGMLRYQNERLTGHWKNVDLDLRRGRGHTWAGQFHRGNFNQMIVLHRPTSQSRSSHGWFLGTWLERFASTEMCVHLGREPDGTFVGWTDALGELGNVRYASNEPKPRLTSEAYGEPAEVHPEGANGVSVELNVLSGWCCPAGFDATQRQPNTMRIEWHGSMSKPPGLLRRVAGESCVENSPEMAP